MINIFDDLLPEGLESFDGLIIYLTALQIADLPDSLEVVLQVC